MKILSKKNTTKKILITSAALAVVFGLALYAAHHFEVWPFKKQATIQTQSPTTQNTSKTDGVAPQAKVDSQKTDTNPNVDTSKTTNEIPASPATSLTITNLSEQNGNVTYSAAITNPGTSGTCSAVFTSKIDRPVTHSEAANGTQCGPTSIPANTFTSIGQWTLTLRYYTNNTQATATKTIEIR